MNLFLDTYAEALKKLDKLQEEEHVLTLGSEDNLPNMQNKMEMAIRQKQLQKEADLLKLKLSEHAENNKTQKNIIQGNRLLFLFIVIFNFSTLYNYVIFSR